MTNEQQIRQLLEQIDPEGKLSQEKIENFISSVQEMEENPVKDQETRNGVHFSVLESELKQQLEQEEDWRKKAAIAAKIISLNLE